MNYRHIYHAGNIADVFKHAVLARIVEYLKRKDTGFRVIDTHAGTGLYDLSSSEAQKTGEWREGIGKLLAAELPDPAAALLKPYLDVVRAHCTEGVPLAYPGSPLLARGLLRKQDRLTACELHPQDFATLAERFTGDWQAKTLHLDGWLVPGSQLPPKEKRGVVLIDPPFEIEGEFLRLEQALQKATGRWPGGIFILWYPLKNTAQVEDFLQNLAKSGISDLVNAQMWAREPMDGMFHGSGLIIRNPPFVLRPELKTILPALVEALGMQGAGWRLETLTAE